MKTHKEKMIFLKNQIDNSFDELKTIFQDLVVRIYQFNEVNLEDVKERLEDSYDKIKKQD